MRASVNAQEMSLAAAFSRTRTEIDRRAREAEGFAQTALDEAVIGSRNPVVNRTKRGACSTLACREQDVQLASAQRVDAQ